MMNQEDQMTNYRHYDFIHLTESLLVIISIALLAFVYYNSFFHDDFQKIPLENITCECENAAEASEDKPEEEPTTTKKPSLVKSLLAENSFTENVSSFRSSENASPSTENVFLSTDSKPHGIRINIKVSEKEPDENDEKMSRKLKTLSSKYKRAISGDMKDMFDGVEDDNIFKSIFVKFQFNMTQILPTFTGSTFVFMATVVDNVSRILQEPINHFPMIILLLPSISFCAINIAFAVKITLIKIHPSLMAFAIFNLFLVGFLAVSLGRYACQAYKNKTGRFP